jgi:hypothetical protein
MLETEQRLIVIVNGISYSWFSVNPSTIDHLTLKLFQDKVESFFGIDVSSQIICDRDGIIQTTDDLRRSLRCWNPSVRILQEPPYTIMDSTIDCSPVRPRSPEPHPSPSTRVLLYKRKSDDIYGFSNVVDCSGAGLVISRIEPSGLLGENAPWVQVGDLVQSVNEYTDVLEMRRELLESSFVELEIRKPPT